MLFAILFDDNPDADPDIRARHMAEHRAFLTQNAASIQAAGPLLDVGTVAGGLWIVDVPAPEAAEDLIKKDPFWPTGLRQSYRILQWRQVFRDGEQMSL